MNAAALLVVLASKAGIVGGSYVTVSVVLAGVVVSVSVAVDVLAAASSTLFLSFIPSVKIVLGAANEVFSAALASDVSGAIFDAGLHPLPFALYMCSLAALNLTFDNHPLPAAAVLVVALYALLLVGVAELCTFAVAAAPKLASGASLVQAAGASAFRSFGVILDVNCNRYVVDLLESLLLTLPLSAVNQVLLGAMKLLGKAEATTDDSLDPAMDQAMEELVEAFSRLSIRNRRRVHFEETAEVRVYNVTLGDHPCSRGYPLTLGWGFAKATVRLDDLEQAKIGVMNRELTPAGRFDRIVRVIGVDPAELERAERWRRWQQAEDDRVAKLIPDAKDEEENIAVSEIEASEPVAVSELVPEEEKGEPMSSPNAVEGCEPMAAPAIAPEEQDKEEELDEKEPAVELCELEHGPFLCGGDDDASDDYDTAAD